MGAMGLGALGQPLEFLNRELAGAGGQEFTRPYGGLPPPEGGPDGTPPYLGGVVL